MKGYVGEMSPRLYLEFCGEDWTLGDGESLSFGRAGDLVIDDNPYLHRIVGRFVCRDGAWWLDNIGSRVTLAVRDYSLEGNLIIIDHGAGLNSAFLHAQDIFVTQGQRVSKGDRLGTVGATGRATGPHLHWSLKWHLARLDPILFTGPMN